jgi:hypothetical protein
MTDNERHFNPAAGRLGIPVDEYLENRGRGLKWCCGAGKHWEPISGFNRNAASWDGLAYECRKCEAVTAAGRQARNRQRNLKPGNPFSKVTA